MEFPELGSTREVRLIQKPEQADDETDEDFKVRLAGWEEVGKNAVAVCTVVGAKTARRWILRHKRIAAYNAKRVYDMQKEIPEAAFPELYDSGYLTEEFGEEIDELALDAMRAGLVSLRGVEFGADDSGALEGEALFESVVQNDLGALILSAILAAQHPGAVENLS